MKYKFTISVTSIGAFLLLIGAGCTSLTSASSKLNNDSNRSVVAPASTAIKSFVVTAKQFSFEPRTINVNKGDTVRLTITSQDVEHSFSLPAFNLNVDLLPGQTKTVEFVASKVGSFTFNCWIFCGDGHSDMAGKLIVQ